MKSQKLFGMFLSLCLIFGLSACARSEAFWTLDAQEVATIASNCEVLYQDHIEAWNSRNPENLRQIYTDDIVHYDGKPLFVGIEAVTNMAEVMFEIFPKWQMEAGKTYISKDQCMGTWANWGIFEFTQDNPGIEYDLLETRDGKISFWRAFYDPIFQKAIDGIENVDEDFLLQFAISWSSGDKNKLAEIYAQDAKLEDTLLGFSIAGQQVITDYTSHFFAANPGARWELIYPFGESKLSDVDRAQYPFVTQGGVFAILVRDADGNPCEIHTALILTPNDQGSIQTQQVFYNADTLLACGWAK